MHVDRSSPINLTELLLHAGVLLADLSDIAIWQRLDRLLVNVSSTRDAKELGGTRNVEVEHLHHHHHHHSERQP